MAATKFKLSIGGVDLVVGNDNMMHLNLTADGADQKAIDLQLTDDQGNPETGAGETVYVRPKGTRFPSDVSSFVVDGAGAGSFVVGPCQAVDGPGEVIVGVEIDQGVPYLALLCLHVTK